MNIIKKNGRIVKILPDIKDGPMRLVGNVFNDGEGIEDLFLIAEHLQSSASVARKEASEA